MELVQKTLLADYPPPPKDPPPEDGGIEAGRPARRRGYRARQLLRWNLTLEDLTVNGDRLSDAIVYKAFKFLENDLLELAYAESLEPEGNREAWILKPLPGYNKTSYTLYFDIRPYRRPAVSCNCQYCVTKERLCSHLTALLIQKGVFHERRNVDVYPGVRNRIEE